MQASCCVRENLITKNFGHEKDLNWFNQPSSLLILLAICVLWLANIASYFS